MNGKVVIPTPGEVELIYHWMDDMQATVSESSTEYERKILALMLKIGKDVLKGMEGNVLDVPPVRIN